MQTLGRIIMSKKILKGKHWAVVTITLAVALILTAWFPADLSAGMKGRAFGNKGSIGNAGVNQIPQEPFKVLHPGDPTKVLIPGDPIKVLTPTDPKVFLPQEPTRVR